MSSEIIIKLKGELRKVTSKQETENLWRSYLGGKGIIKQELKKIGIIPPEERKGFAIKIQQLEKEAKKLFEEKQKEVLEMGSKKQIKEETEELGFDLPKIGHLHPLTETMRELNRFFQDMGYSIMDGPEIETDEFCFERLGVPKDHPAREMQDTIYIKEPNHLLRTQTSSIEARLLNKYKPPLKVVSPGTAYRNEKVNPSNHFILHHYQGVVVMPEISLKDLFGTFTALFKKMYGEKVIVRYRNKYYPEVEPGVGPDMQCFNCQGKGCRVCKGVGWIEMGGAGIIHPHVLRSGGIDPKKWHGFAFGLGLDRWTMARYGIIDIRTLLGGNLGYKPQEGERNA